jgi:ubiquinone/menaquinone biosynthesis C-methylase UbiE
MPTAESEFTKTEVKGVFDSQASYYAGERGQSPWFQAQLKIVLEMLDPGPGLILDIGCAAGAEFQPLQARGFEIVGIDYSPEMLRLARQRLGPSNRVPLCRADAEQLPFPNASFDHVVCLGVFEYLNTYDLCLDEIYRVLRPGGVVIISLPTDVSLDRVSNKLFNKTVVPVVRMIKKMMGKRTSSQPVGGSWNRCIPSQFERRLIGHKLTPERSAYSGFLLFPLGQVWPAGEYRLFLLMERFSKSSILGWTLSQYLISARKASTV